MLNVLPAPAPPPPRQMGLSLQQWRKRGGDKGSKNRAMRASADDDEPPISKKKRSGEIKKSTGTIILHPDRQRQAARVTTVFYPSPVLILYYFALAITKQSVRDQRKILISPSVPPTCNISWPRKSSFFICHHEEGG